MSLLILAALPIAMLVGYGYPATVYALIFGNHKRSLPWGLVTLAGIAALTAIYHAVEGF